MTVSLRTVHATAFALSLLTAFEWHDAGEPWLVCLAVVVAVYFTSLVSASALAAIVGVEWRT